MQELRANTAVDVLIGPFVDDADGDTPLTGLTLVVELSKNGQGLAAKNDATAPVHDAGGTVDGYYNCELDDTDTNTEGALTLAVHHADALPVRHEFMVLAEAAWDSKYVAKDDGFMDVNIKTIGRADTTETQADNLETACGNYSATRGLAGTALPEAAADAAGGLPISDLGGLDLDVYLKSGVTLIGTANAGDTVIKITLTGGVATANYYNGQLVIITGGTGAGQSRTILKYLADGSATPTRDFSVAPDGTSTFVVIGADVAGLLEAGEATDGGNATITLDAEASAENNSYKSNYIVVTGGTGAGQTRLITAYNGTSKKANVVPNWITNPAAGSIYMIIPSGYVNVGEWLGEEVSLSTNNKPDVNIDEWHDVLLATTNPLDTAFTTQMADSVPADGTIATREQALYMILQFLTEKSISGVTMTVKKVDGSTALMTFTLDDAADPTSITRAT